jgi:hypothetical protein
MHIHGGHSKATTYDQALEHASAFVHRLYHFYLLQVAVHCVSDRHRTCMFCNNTANSSH